MKEINLVVFGTGKFYKNRKEKFKIMNNIQICAFLDNNEALWETSLDNIPVYSPMKLKDIQYDYIVLMSTYATEMYEQLMQIGVNKGKVLYWGQFIAQFSRKKEVYYSERTKANAQHKKILIVTIKINYDGGTMAVIYAAKSLQLKNYQVVLAAPDGNEKLIHEINNYGIDVIVYDALPYIEEEEWVKEYKAVIVNTFPMIQCACEISKYKAVLWWIHESSNVYDVNLKQFYKYANKENMRQISIYAVSNIAKQNFNAHFYDRIKKTLSFGIPDLYNLDMKTDRKDKIVFAIIGVVTKIKLQDIFLKAANKLEANIDIEFWIIGRLNKGEYGEQIVEIAKQNHGIKLKGELTREEMCNIFPQIDVVVCTSQEETMSIAIIEGMMFRKICITTNHTGIADYIQDGENGFVVAAGDIEALHNKMQWIIDNRDQINEIGVKARETYKKYFSMNVFGENLDKAVSETVKKWKQRS